MNTLELTAISPIVPVVILEDEKHALPLAHALLEGGIAIMEVTLRSGVAMKCIERIASDLPEMYVGAGTVINIEQMRSVHAAGGRFCFSPGIEHGMLEHAHRENIPFIPGVATASEVMLAINAGYEVCKLFPAAAVGGVPLLKGFSGPFGNVKFCPTGGVNLDNMNEYLSLDNVPCIGGSWIVPIQSMRDGNFEQITELCRTALNKAT